MESIFLEIGMIIVAAGIFGYLARLFKQPLIPALIIAGIYLGPVQGIITDKETIASISEIGIALLLFSAGLELNLRKLKEVGNVALFGALAHMVVLFSAGYAIFSFLGFDKITSIYIGLLLIFSSTLVVVKLLSDRNELDTLHGRIIVAILLVQDVVAIIALTLLSSVGTESVTSIVLMFLQGVIVMFAGYALAKLAFASIFKFAAKNDELLFLLSVFTLFAFAIMFYQLGFSIAIGAFVAGLLIGHLPYKYEILSQVKGIKEFFSTIFFVSIGLSLMPVSLTEIITPLTILFLMIIILIPLSIMLMLGFFGYKRKTAFTTGICLAQVSEFSLIMFSAGFQSGHISDQVYSMTILLALITIITTSYIIKYSEKIYQLIGKRLYFIELLSPHRKELSGYQKPGEKYDVVLAGYDRLGYGIYKKLKSMGKKILIVDMNPDIIHKLIDQKIPCLYGDVSDPEIMNRIYAQHLDLLVSTIPKHTENKIILSYMRIKNPQATLVVTAYEATEAMELYALGADYVIVPHFLGGEHVSLLLNELTGNLKGKVKIKLNHMKALEERKKRHPHHI